MKRSPKDDTPPSAEEYRKLQEELELSKQRFQTLTTLTGMLDEPEQRIKDYVLEESVRTTRSTIGYLYFMNEDETELHLHAWSTGVMKECTMDFKPQIYKVEETGLWGEAARRRKPIITNDYEAPNPLKKSYPEGHVPIKRHMNIPLIEDGKIVLIAGVGNKEEPYEESDIQQLTLIMAGMWRIIRKKWADEELHKYREHLENLVEQRTQRLEQVNRELADFAYVVSHDLKAPLRAVSQLSQWLLEDYRDSLDEEGQEKLKLLRQRVLRMHGLIEGILTYSRIGRKEENPGPIDLQILAKEILDSLSPPPHISVSIVDPLPVVKADRTRMEQVLMNLLANAVTYMDKPEGIIRIGCEDQDTHWRFRVEDNGPGIDPRYHEKIFVIFQTLRPADESRSSGIGLTLVKKIIRIYGGEIWVESQKGQGAAFYFTLPKMKE